LFPKLESSRIELVTQREVVMISGVNAWLFYVVSNLANAGPETSGTAIRGSA
jgi:hypothetical protein